MRRSFWTAVVGVVALTLGTPAHAGKRLSQQLLLPASLAGTIGTEGCFNSGGPSITLGGVLRYGSAQGTLVFTNNRRFKRVTSSDVAVDVVLSDFTEQQIAKGGPGGVGGNPHMSWQASTSTGELIAESTYLGRCNEAPMSVDASFVLPVLAELEISGLCDNRGSHITLSGTLTASGVSGTLSLQNSLSPGRGNQHQDSVGAELALELTPDGGQTAFRKGQGGPGGNPHLFLTLDGWQTLHYLGRCNDLR